MIRDPVAVAAVIAAISALAFWLDRNVAWAGKVGASLLVIVFGAVLSNAGLVPAESPVYGVIGGPVTSLAIVWLLFAVDLREVRTAGPRMLAAFLLAVAASASGAVLGVLVFGDFFAGEAWKLAGVLTATYSGGSLNFVAVGRELDLPPALFTAATAADNVVTAVWMGATLTLPLLLARRYPPVPVGRVAVGRGETRLVEPPEEAAWEAEHPFFAAAPFRVVDAAALLALGLGLLLAARGAASVVPAVPEVLWLTTFALAVAQLPAVRRLAGAMQLGTLALHFFFALIGIASRVSEILAVGMEVFYLTAMVVAVHGLLIYGVGRLARFDVGTVSVASQAAVGGPSTALALAVAREWPALALPGLVAGLAGYAVGSYAGFGVAFIMRGLLG